MKKTVNDFYFSDLHFKYKGINICSTMMMPQNKYNTQINDSFLENNKNELLLALYEKDYHKAHGIFSNILQHINSIVSLDENSEKLLNQVHLMIKKLSPESPEHIWIELKKNDKFLNNYILSFIKNSTRTITHINFQSWEEGLGLNLVQNNLLFKTAMTFQLSVGCSNFCRRCNEWALPKVRSHFSFTAIKKILCFMEAQQNDEISLYGASDPLDWVGKNNSKKKYGLDEKQKNISDIIDYLHTLPMQYNILTKVPKGKGFLLKDLVKSNANLAVSITSKNKTRIATIENDLELPIGKQHDLDELLIPAFLDEDFISIKPSITDGYGAEITPDGAFIIIPTFTTALHPLGHKKIPITCKTNFFPVKAVGRDALLVDYFKPLKGYNLNNKIIYLDYLLDVQIESIILDNGKESLTPPGMRSLKEYLSIFDEKPRLQRKKMTKTVLKRLKKQFLFNTSFKNIGTQTRKLYLKKIMLHLDLCKKDKCLEAKLLAVSFFLKAILMYVKKNQTKTSIMEYLLKNDIKYADNTIFDTRQNRAPQNILSSDSVTSFKIFQYFIFQLLENPDNKVVLKFIKTYPSKYDPVTDIFIQAR